MTATIHRYQRTSGGGAPIPDERYALALSELLGHLNDCQSCAAAARDTSAQLEGCALGGALADEALDAGTAVKDARRFRARHQDDRHTLGEYLFVIVCLEAAMALGFFGLGIIRPLDGWVRSIWPTVAALWGG